MIKEERLNFIKAYLQKHKVIQVQYVVDNLNVADMTVRRDLKTLEEMGFLTRIHGGAKLKEADSKLSAIELSHLEKKKKNLNEKKEIARKAAQEIEDFDIVFLGSGTTIELIYDYLEANHVKIITNSIFVFEKFKNDNRFQLILIGGHYRSLTGAFVGTIASDYMKNIFIKKAFIGVNALDQEFLYNANEEEGEIQRIALDNAEQTYILADSSKFDKQDFYRFYDLKGIDYLITDQNNSAAFTQMDQHAIKIIK
ncbi:DeoR/GlpR family DNA-binding transcription regulator [Ignavigranum ruoffiae]|uniref:DeoR/GlpR family DNA-binding transcription regulator n=1 Tax=Ignavigranum ruoffiae TaxID=89093 RepID=UPI0020649130|nr:DeoR/GlpR family DNA-binding transcription regulator [Ignavigranum ruoffiae]UPQ86334.1 DeoR/GlpR family DNA-binding transcription regulator [Ignavigranum ruoffiae]